MDRIYGRGNGHILGSYLKMLSQINHFDLLRSLIDILLG